jgi:hypothetical protein
MSQSLDRLARDLAAGVSRRKALWRFVSGLGVLGVLSQRKASAIVIEPFPGPCQSFCEQQAQFFVAMCMAASTGCPEGYCAELTPSIINGVGINNTLAVNGGPGGNFVCVQVQGTAQPGGGIGIGLPIG